MSFCGEEKKKGGGGGGVINVRALFVVIVCCSFCFGLFFFMRMKYQRYIWFCQQERYARCEFNDQNCLQVFIDSTRQRERDRQREKHGERQRQRWGDRDRD